MLRRLYDTVVRHASAPHAIWWLVAVSFAESSIFPIPPDILLVPMALANRNRAFWLAFVCAVSSVVGGLAGYGIGYFLFESIGKSIIDFYGLQASFEHFARMFNEYGAWIIIIKGATPVPYKLLTITAGVTHMDIVVFTLSSLVSRTARFFVFAVLLWYFGEPMREFIEKRLMLVTTLLVVLIVGGFLLIKLF